MGVLVTSSFSVTAISEVEFNIYIKELKRSYTEENIKAKKDLEKRL